MSPELPTFILQNLIFIGTFAAILKTNKFKIFMKRYINKTFFKFFLGFILILFISFMIMITSKVLIEGDSLSQDQVKIEAQSN